MSFSLEPMARPLAPPLPLEVRPDSSLTTIPFDKTTRGTKITQWVDPKSNSGEFVRQQSSFRNWISRENGAQFPAEKGRYHLFVSYACPWVRVPKPSLALHDSKRAETNRPHHTPRPPEP